MFASLKLGLIARYLRPQRKQLLRGALALLVVNLLGTTLPLLVQRTVNSLKPGFSLGDLLHQALWIALLASAMAGVRLWSRVLVFGAGRQVEILLRQRIFDHLLKQEPGWVQTAGSGEVISRSTSDVENVRRLLGFAVLSLANTALAYAFTLPAMLAIDPWLSLAAIILYPLMLVVVGASGGRMMSQQRQQQQNLAQLSDLIQEDLSGISAIKIYGQEPTEVGAFASLSKRYRDAAIALARTRSTLFPLLEGISSLSLLVLLALGSGQLRIPQQGVQIFVGDAQQRQVEVLGQQSRNLVAQHRLVPLAQLSQFIVRDAVGPAFRLIEVAEPDHWHILQPQHRGGQHPAMPRDQLAIVGHHAGHGPAELRHAGGDLRDLVGAVDLCVSGIWAQPVERLSLDLTAHSTEDGHEDQAHGAALSGKQTCRSALGYTSDTIRIREVGENESAREGYPPGAILR